MALVDARDDDDVDTDRFPSLASVPYGQWDSAVGSAAHGSAISSQDWEFRSVLPTPAPRRRDKPPHLGLAALGVVVVVLAMVAAWLWWPSASDTDSGAAPETSVAPQPNDPDQTRLQSLLPAGYPADACRPADAPARALAALECDRNGDSGGPATATYVLTAAAKDVEAVFDSLVADLDVVVCPGNIQSPGPWRRNADPSSVAGTLVCANRGAQSVVAWTTADSNLVSVAYGEGADPALSDLYRWWTTHS